MISIIGQLHCLSIILQHHMISVIWEDNVIITSIKHASVTTLPKMIGTISAIEDTLHVGEAH